MLTIYKKNMRKYWLIGISFPMAIVIFIPFIAFIWPELKESISAFADILENPLYQVLLGGLSMEDLSTWQGMFFMYIFMLLEWVMIFFFFFIPARLISSESDNRTLDVMLSYPVPRWRYMLEKFSVYLTYNLLYPIMIILSTMFFSELIGEEIDLLVVG
ncbi:MAG: ABC transporter permease subunit, partial [Candidatus Hodarchaeales archaeon]